MVLAFISRPPPHRRRKTNKWHAWRKNANPLARWANGSNRRPWFAERKRFYYHHQSVLGRVNTVVLLQASEAPSSHEQFEPRKIITYPHGGTCRRLIQQEDLQCLTQNKTTHLHLLIVYYHSLPTNKKRYDQVLTHERPLCLGKERYYAENPR